MWWRSKEDPPKSSGVRSQMRKHLIGRGTPSDPGNTPTSARSNNGVEEAAISHMSETMSGIGLSFLEDTVNSPERLHFGVSPGNNNITNNTHAKTSEGVLSLQSQLWRYRSVHYAQLNMSATSASAPSPRIITPVIASLAGPDLSEFQRRKHRVPIGNHVNTQTFDDTLFLLRSYEVFDERKCVEEEIANVSSEIDALEQDRADLLQKVSFISLVNSSSLDDPDTVAPNNESTNNNTQWKDANRLLARAHNLSHKERVQLQEERGLYLTVCMYDAESRDALFEKCGVINSFSKQLKQHFFLYESSSTIKEVGPQDYPDGGGLATIQQIAFMKASTSDDSLSFVVGKDKDKSLVHGNIPDTLFMRIKRMGLDLKQHVAEIVYLATGPMGSYYAEFRNGACWWGIPGDDDDFDTVCNDAKWDVARVAFGPCIILYDAHQQPHYVNSWIIIGRNGRVAWKNVPSRLHNLLERRLSSAPACCEVALGSVGSYFVRFVDGTVDYCLPAEPARVCRSLEESGATIMSMSLHPELTHDFVIRSRR